MRKIFIPAIASVLFSLLATAGYLITSLSVRAQSAALPEFEKEISWNYAVKYKDAGRDISKLPFALKILDTEQPAKMAVKLRPAKFGEFKAMGLLLKAQNRNGTETTTENILIELKGELRWMRIEQTMKSKSGEIIREERHHIDNPMFNYPDDIFSRECLLLVVVRNMLLHRTQKETVTAWTGPVTVWSLDLIVKGNEKVSVPAGAFNTVIVELKPLAKDFFGPRAGAVVQPFVPVYKAWYETAAPFRLVKYEGPLGLMPNTQRLFELWELLP